MDPPPKLKYTYSDSEIAKLLLLESQSSASASGSQFHSFHHLHSSSSSGRVVKTNKRFLKSVIRNVNDHNKQLERKPEEGIRKSGGGKMRDDGRTSNLQQQYRSSRCQDVDDIQAEKASRKSRHLESPRRTGHPRDKPYHGTHSRDCEQGNNTEERRTKRSEHKKEKTSHRSSRTTKYEDDEEHEQGPNLDDTQMAGPSNEPRTEQTCLPSRSKMDKYFSSTYDPRLDVQLDDITDPITGLIHGGNYDDWENILAQLKAKRDAKSKIREDELQKKLIAAQRKLKKIERKKKKSLKHKSNETKQSKKEKDEFSSDELEVESDKKLSRKKRKSEIKDEEIIDKEKKRKHSEESKINKPKKERDESRNVKTNKRKRDRKDSITSSDTSSDSNSSIINQNKNVNLIQFNGYSKQGKLREWDLGKPSPT